MLMFVWPVSIGTPFTALSRLRKTGFWRVDVVQERRAARARPGGSTAGWPARSGTPCERGEAGLGRDAHRAARRGRRVVGVVLVEQEEERLVLDDRPADAGARLVARVVGRLREAAAFSMLVSEARLVRPVVVPDLAAEAVGARLGDDVDLRAAVAAELDAVGVRLHLELGHRLGHDLRGRDRDADVVVVRAVDHVVVVARALAVGGVGALAGDAADVRARWRSGC